MVTWSQCWPYLSLHKIVSLELEYLGWIFDAMVYLKFFSVFTSICQIFGSFLPHPLQNLPSVLDEGEYEVSIFYILVQIFLPLSYKLNLPFPLSLSGETLNPINRILHMNVCEIRRSIDWLSEPFHWGYRLSYN